MQSWAKEIAICGLKKKLFHVYLYIMDNHKNFLYEQKMIMSSNCPCLESNQGRIGAA